MAVGDDSGEEDQDEEEARMVQYQHILMDVAKMGRQLLGAKRRGSSTKNSLPQNEKEAEQLHYLVGNACGALQVAKIRRADIDKADLQRNIDLVETQGVRLALEHQQWLTVRKAQDLLEDHKCGEWAKLMVLSTSGSVDEPTEWTSIDRRFKWCLPEPTSDVKEVQKFGKIWQEAAFTDPFLSALSDAGQQGDGPSKIIKLCESFLAASGESSFPQWAEAFTTPTVKVFRGILALVSPVPYKYQGTTDDVNFVLPCPGKPTSIVKDLRVGKLVLAKLKPAGPADPVWADRKQESMSPTTHLIFRLGHFRRLSRIELQEWGP